MPRRLLVALALGVAVRAPFWLVALRTPPDADTAIVGLMARHPGVGTSFWGQPYGSPLEAWLASPALALLGSTPSALRVFYFILGLALIPLAFGLGRALHPAAALPAALLAACPPPYLLVLAAMPPPLYPLALVLSASLLLLGLRLGPRLAQGERPVLALAGLGALAGLALWTHLMTAGAALAAAVHLWRCRRRAPPDGRSPALLGLWPLLAGAAASAPAWLRLLADPQAANVIRPWSLRESTLDNVAALLSQLHVTLGGLLGTFSLAVADDKATRVDAPAWAAAGIAAAYALLAAAIATDRAARRRRAQAPEAPGAESLFLAVIALSLLAFLVPARSRPYAIRFVTPVWLPFLALSAGVLARRLREGTAVLAALALGVLHLAGAARLHAAWSSDDPAQARQRAPDLRPVLSFLEERGLRHGYASYETAYRLTFESGERVVFSQPWNQRFRNHPLPYLDEVRFARDVAWVLAPGGRPDLPSPAEFADALAASGGSCRREDVGPAVVFHACVPPYGPRVVPLASAGPAGDGDLATRLTLGAGQGVTFALAEPAELSGIALLAGVHPPELPRSLDVEVSGDGVRFERVAGRRRLEERADLRWAGGHPQFLIDQAFLSIPFGARRVSAVRLTPVEWQEPWSLAEVLLHPADDAPRPWDDWLPPLAGWSARRSALQRDARPEREDWYFRSQLAERRTRTAAIP